MNTGAMIALLLPSDVAQSVAVPGGEPAEELHVTLVFLGEAAALTIGHVMKVHEIVSSIASAFSPLEARLSGVGRFSASENSDAKEPFYISVDSPTLPGLRETLIRGLEANGIPYAKDHGFSPHITVEYLLPGTPPPSVTLPTELVSFGSIALVVADATELYPLIGVRRALEDDVSVIRHPGHPSQKVHGRKGGSKAGLNSAKSKGALPAQASSLVAQEEMEGLADKAKRAKTPADVKKISTTESGDKVKNARVAADRERDNGPRGKQGYQEVGAGAHSWGIGSEAIRGGDGPRASKNFTDAADHYGKAAALFAPQRIFERIAVAVGRPFSGYKDMSDCMKQNKDKTDPGAYCAGIHKKATGKWPSEKRYEEEEIEMENVERFIPSVDRYHDVFVQALEERLKSLLDADTVADVIKYARAKAGGSASGDSRRRKKEQAETQNAIAKLVLGTPLTQMSEAELLTLADAVPV